MAEYIEEGKEKDYLFRYLKSKKEGSKITCKNFNGDKLVLCYPKRLDKKYAGYKKEKEITEDYIILSKHPKEFIFFEKLRVHKNRIVNTSTENRLVKKWTGL